MLNEIKKSLSALALIEKIEVEKKVSAIPPEGDAPAEEGSETPVVETEIIEQAAITSTDYAQKGFHLDLKVAPDDVVIAAQKLRDAGFFIESVTGVDWIKEDALEVVYDYNNFEQLCRVVIRTTLSRSNPEVPTISEIFSGANWHERETHDFYGIKFTGHPDLSPLLLEEDADYHPLLKDFKA